MQIYEVFILKLMTSFLKQHFGQAMLIKLKVREVIGNPEKSECITNFDQQR